jgi:hypothetical protein
MGHQPTTDTPRGLQTIIYARTVSQGFRVYGRSIEMTPIYQKQELRGKRKIRFLAAFSWRNSL